MSIGVEMEPTDVVSRCNMVTLTEEEPYPEKTILDHSSGENINIAALMNKSRGEFAYTMLDLDHHPSQEVVESLKKIEGVLRVRVIK